jgi:transposase-like protein
MGAHGMWREYDERAFGYTKGQWKEWKRQWQEAGAYLGDARGSESESERERRHARMNELEVSEKATLERHNAFQRIIEDSSDVLTTDQEADVEQFIAWLDTVEEGYEFEGIA